MPCARAIENSILAISCGIASLCGGCSADPEAAPRYVQNWYQVRNGLTKQQIATLLGEPASRQLPATASQDGVRGMTNLASDYVGNLVLSCLFDTGCERWEYGQFDFMENLLTPANSAYVVYFDRRDHVIRFRAPLESSASQPDENNGCDCCRCRPATGH